jgi:DnaK suppressor protein
MNPDKYKQRLLAREQELSARVERAMAAVREPGDGGARDSSDESVNDEGKDEQFTEAEADRTVLGQVRDALKRIDEGTFGTCAVDGGPIEEARLEAVPWTPYCLKHQQLREADAPPRTPTL